jgi:pimeloyl-ACP methyl ester carboxylesterase
MQFHLDVDGAPTYVSTCGRDHRPGQPTVVFLHGAGMDHTVWALQSRWLAFRGVNVLAVDLPGHGRSGGAALGSIAEFAHWVARLLDAASVERAALIGHSMGALIALECAALYAARVSHLVLVGAAATMPVGAALLSAAQEVSHDAVDMVNLWGHGARAGIGANAAPGLWMVGVGERILEGAAPGVLYTDLAACHAYANGLAAAAAVTAPTLIVAGERDLMTPVRGARALAAAVGGARLVVLPEAGHMLMAERPNELVAEIRQHLGIARERTVG